MLVGWAGGVLVVVVEGVVLVLLVSCAGWDGFGECEGCGCYGGISCAGCVGCECWSVL